MTCFFLHPMGYHMFCRFSYWPPLSHFNIGLMDSFTSRTLKNCLLFVQNENLLCRSGWSCSHCVAQVTHKLVEIEFYQAWLLGKELGNNMPRLCLASVVDCLSPMTPSYHSKSREFWCLLRPAWTVPTLRTLVYRHASDQSWNLCHRRYKDSPLWWMAATET